MKNEKDEVFDGIHGHINELDDFLYRHFDELEKLKVLCMTDNLLRLIVGSRNERIVPKVTNP